MRWEREERKWKRKGREKKLFFLLLL